METIKRNSAVLVWLYTDVSKGECPGKSGVSLLPINDLNPANITCIFFTYTFVEHQIKELEIMTPPVITFQGVIQNFLGAAVVRRSAIMTVIKHS